MMSSARMTGRTPLSPLRIRVSQARNHSLRDWATSSGGTPIAAAAAAVGSWACSGASARATLCSITTRWLPGTTRGTGGHVIDDSLPVEVRGPALGHHPAEVYHGNPVRDLEDIVQVVRDHHDGKAAVPQPPDQVEHLLGVPAAWARRR